ncbi:hypothetical protein GWI33_017060 [Rhynchophorus ferrugineus]|uniref:Uncharacterized protein n=1 Tax=Rhynchophorus ferrugineus TaxID=354439 RepID=A0A834HWU3_RHYFE|nr:hypothetical protein GWI33_017060 [Rhynchophorus ferrugineus]
MEQTNPDTCTNRIGFPLIFKFEHEYPELQLMRFRTRTIFSEFTPVHVSYFGNFHTQFPFVRFLFDQLGTALVVTATIATKEIPKAYALASMIAHVLRCVPAS